MNIIQDGPDVVYVRFKVGMIAIDDAKQQIKPDVDIFVYWTPTYKVKNVDKGRKGRFKNLIGKPEWVPHFDFANECEEALVTDESYWYDDHENLIFGRLNVIPHLQERFNYQSFPFDRLICDIQILCNNVIFKAWEAKDFPVELSLRESTWLIQANLNGLADTFQLKHCFAEIENDECSSSSQVSIDMLLERRAGFYLRNFIFVYFLIILTQTTMLVFPFNQSRFEFALALSLTSVAFQFVTTTQVPKSAYLTSLDTYMILGFILVAFRFLGDILMQTLFELPTGENTTCTKIDSQETVCDVDFVFTMALSGIWTLGSLAYMIFGKSLLQSPWRKLMRVDGKTIATTQETIGAGSITVIEKPFTASIFDHTS